MSLRTVGPVYQFRHTRMQDRLGGQVRTVTHPDHRAALQGPQSGYLATTVGLTTRTSEALMRIRQDRQVTATTIPGFAAYPKEV